jgi:hypothetical protein
MEEALLLNLHPVMHYVLNRRTAVFDTLRTTDLAVEPSSGHALHFSTVQHSFTRYADNRPHLRSSCKHSNLSDPINFLEQPLKIWSRFLYGTMVHDK